MVESSLEFSAGGTTDGAVPFLEFTDKDTGELGETCAFDSRICRPRFNE